MICFKKGNFPEFRLIGAVAILQVPIRVGLPKWSPRLRLVAEIPKSTMRYYR
jgi:hypothetical protein